MEAYKPRGWKVKMGAAAQQRGGSGVCDYDLRTIFVPLVCDDYSLMVYLHEVGHARLHRTSTACSHVLEYEAEMFSQKALRACGFSVSREVTRTSKDYVSEEVKKDRVRGLPIDPKIERWATRKSRAKAH
jgi:hypothetical protein